MHIHSKCIYIYIMHIHPKCISHQKCKLAPQEVTARALQQTGPRLSGGISCNWAPIMIEKSISVKFA